MRESKSRSAYFQHFNVCTSTIHFFAQISSCVIYGALIQAILRDKSERCFNEVGGAQEGGASSGNSNQICGSVTAPSPTLLDTAILKLLKKLKSFYDRAYKRNPVKVRSSVSMTFYRRCGI